jgi:hypothetical protein
MVRRVVIQYLATSYLPVVVTVLVVLILPAALVALVAVVHIQAELLLAVATS